MKKSISIFIHCFPPAKGGLEYLIKEVKKILDKNYTVHIITGNGSTLDSYKTFKDFLPKNSQYKINHVHRLDLDFPKQRLFNKLFGKIIPKWGLFSPFYFGPILKYPPKILDIIKNSDIIIGSGMPTMMFYQSYLFAKKFDKKLILIPAYHNVPYYNNCPFFQQALNYASKILYLTPLERKYLTKNYKIDQSKLNQATFCPYTIEQIKSQQKKLPDIISQKLKRLKNKQVNIGFIGQITPRKNLVIFKHYLDKYLPYWQSRGYKLTIHLSGAKTSFSNQIEQLLKDHIKNNIVNITYNFKDLENEYSKFDVFVNPSVEESLGITNFEALYNGLSPIVHSDSAFADLTDKKSAFNNIDKLHEIITKNTPPASTNMSLLSQYNYDNFEETINDSFIQDR